MLKFLKFLPKLLFDQKVKFYIGLLMLVKAALEDVLKGKEHSLAIDAAVLKAHTLLPAEIRRTASVEECQNAVDAALDLADAVRQLFEENPAGPPAPAK